jgi:hypothetical protein
MSSSRARVRTKLVVPLHVIRKGRGEKQLAHTLDITEVSAKLGGLNITLEPGEVVEILRGPIRSRFQVRWVGEPGTALEGQAGIQSLEPGKPIWGVHWPQNRTENPPSADRLRSAVPRARSSSPVPGSKRWHERCQCSGTATIKTARASFPIHGQIKDISENGVYVEISTPLPRRTDVILDMKVENFRIVASGTVRTSYPLLGMGITFKDLTDSTREMLACLLAKLNQGDFRELGDPLRPYPVPAEALSAEPREPAPNPAQDAPPPNTERYRVRVLAMACQTLATNFDAWTRSWSPDEIEELRLAVNELHQKL